MLFERPLYLYAKSPKKSVLKNRHNQWLAVAHHPYKRMREMVFLAPIVHYIKPGHLIIALFPRTKIATHTILLWVAINQITT